MPQVTGYNYAGARNPPKFIFLEKVKFRKNRRELEERELQRWTLVQNSQLAPSNSSLEISFSELPVTFSIGFSFSTMKIFMLRESYFWMNLRAILVNGAFVVWGNIPSLFLHSHNQWVASCNFPAGGCTVKLISVLNYLTKMFLKFIRDCALGNNPTLSRYLF